MDFLFDHSGKVSREFEYEDIEHEATGIDFDEIGSD